MVRVARSSFLTNAAVVVGEGSGEFAREGIRLQYVDQPNTSVQALPGLARGDVDVVASVVSTGLINAIGGGADLRIVADRGHLAREGCESFGVVGRRSLFGDSAVNEKLLRGRRVSANPVGQSGYLTALFLAKHGLRITDVKIVRLPATSERQALDAGGLDISSRNDPFFYQMMQGGHRLLAGGNELAPGAHIALLVFGPNLLQKDRELGMRFMRAYLRGVRRYAEGKTGSNMKYISTGLKFDTADLRKMCWPPTHLDGAVNLQSLTDFQSWAVQSGHLVRVVEPKSLVDLHFVQAATQTLAKE